MEETRRELLRQTLAGGSLLLLGGSAVGQDAKTNQKGSLSAESLVVRIDPTTGKEVSGALVWTTDFGNIDAELVYVPDATEFIARPHEPPSKRIKTPHRHLHLPDDEPIGKALAAAPKPLSQVCQYYTGACDGGDSYTDNCAHYLSNAFIRAGYTELLTSGIITARCRSGAKRPIRAYDMLKWFQYKKKRFRSGVIPQGNGVWATYQEKPGWKHVLISDTDKWEYCGTGDYPDWPTQWNYQW